MASAWYLERWAKDAAGASWRGDFTDFAQALEFATSVIGGGKGESIRFTAPDGASTAQIEQLAAVGGSEI